MNITSAGGIIAMLDEKDPELKYFALTRLNDVVDSFWPEISEYVTKIEMLYEDNTFKHQELAALVASKVFYHLGAFEESVSYALCAGNSFTAQQASEYGQTILEKCIDRYINLRSSDSVVDGSLESLVNQMFQRCLDSHQYKQTVGIALECRRMDIFEKAILESDDIEGMLSYAFKVGLSLVQSRHFQIEVLTCLVKLYNNLATPDYISVCQCLIFLDEPLQVASILEKLLNKNQDSVLMAYQIGFDLYESATQQFLQRVTTALKPPTITPATSATPAISTIPAATEARIAEAKAAKRIDPKADATTATATTLAAIPAATTTSANTTATSKAADGKDGKQFDEEGCVVPMEVTESGSTSAQAQESATTSPQIPKNLSRLLSILDGDVTISLHLQFLIRSNKTDLLILKNTKEVIRNSICHNATVISHSLMQAGTTCDQFLRDNLDWLGRATNWAKFTATASLGTIHKGHEKEALHLMSTYLPRDSGAGSAYSEGGGLYALGLIHANHGGKITDYLLEQAREATTDAVRHGACLGLGLVAMGTSRDDVYEQLKLNLFQDDAVTGEAAGLGMGLVMLGTGSPEAASDMVTYARDTQHEKIMRGLAIGVALLQYGRLEESDALVHQLALDKDSILRSCAAYSVGMAYCGTGNNKAVQRLLHMAVSDVSDDVRRAAVTSLGFLQFRTPEQCPGVVSLLSESYNPHVRYGSAMALGIACAGTGLKEALALLDPLTSDPVNFVRQGALIASAMVLIQHNENTAPKVAHFRQLYAKLIADKHEDVMAKFGAILAQGIIDAGGRNCTISLQSRTGHTNMETVVGLLVFLQFWYWYPLTHFLSLALTPSALIALNGDLNMPKLEFHSRAKPSLFAYPPRLEEKKEKNREKVETAVLSTTAKQQKRKATTEKKEQLMEVDEPEQKDKDKKDDKKPDKAKDAKSKDALKDVKSSESTKDAKAEEDKKEEVKKEVEPNFEMLSNPARVMKPQLKVMTLAKGCRYIGMKEVGVGGVVVVKNLKPGEDEVIVEVLPAGGVATKEVEPSPPEPFEYDE